MLRTLVNWWKVVWRFYSIRFDKDNWENVENNCDTFTIIILVLQTDIYNHKSSQYLLNLEGVDLVLQTCLKRNIGKIKNMDKNNI